MGAETKTSEAAAGHNTLVLRIKTFWASIAHERTDRTSRRAEVPTPEEAALRAAPQRGRPPSTAAPPLWTPLVEESQPSGLSSPHTHAPCWLKESFSLKLRCCAPQLPPTFFSPPEHEPEPEQNEHLSAKRQHLIKLTVDGRHHLFP